jgi:hypothetical protein
MTDEQIENMVFAFFETTLDEADCKRATDWLVSLLVSLSGHYHRTWPVLSRSPLPSRHRRKPPAFSGAAISFPCGHTRG